MTGRSLREIEQETERERRAAQRWTDKHGVGSLPGRRSETGETATRQMVGHSGDSEEGGSRDEALPRKHRDAVSYDRFDTLAAWEDWMLDSGVSYTPLVSSAQPEPSMDSLEKRSRMNHVFTFMQPRHVELLYWRHVEGMTLEAISRQESVSRQAIAKRLAVAEADFKAAFAAHWNDLVTWEV